MNKTPTNITFFLLSILIGCSSLEYGYLPGDDYTIYPSKLNFDLKHNKYRVEVKDERGTITSAECLDYSVKRNTELEGPKGTDLIDNYITKSIQDSKGIISTDGKPISIGVQALSYRISGFLFIKIEAVVQISLKLGNTSKTICTHLSDRDKGAPVEWNSLDTRIGASRKIVSATIRLAVDQVLSQLTN